MQLTKVFRRGVALSLAFLLVGAAPAPKVIPLPGNPDEGLIVPAGSPVQFSGFDKYGGARFRGRFVLTGTFTYGCEVDCDGPVKEADLELNVVPDPTLAARLPHWKTHYNDMMIYIRRGSRLAHVIAGPKARTALLTGKTQHCGGEWQ